MKDKDWDWVDDHELETMIRHGLWGEESEVVKVADVQIEVELGLRVVQKVAAAKAGDDPEAEVRGSIAVELGVVDAAAETEGNYEAEVRSNLAVVTGDDTQAVAAPVT